MADARPNASPAMTRPERWILGPFLFAARLGVAAVSATLWVTIVLPVWVFLVLRAMAVIALKNVINVYRGAGTLEVATLERVVLFWPRGLMTILRIVGGRYECAEVRPRHPLEAVQETLLAAVFFTTLMFSAELAKHYASVVLAARDWLQPHVHAGTSAVFELLRQHTLFPF